MRDRTWGPRGGPYTASKKVYASNAEREADALEAQAAATPNEAQENALNAKADAIEQQAGNADGGATTANTSDTSPSK